MTKPPSTRLLHEAGGIRIHHRPGRTDWTLVAFGPRQAPQQGDQWWGAGLGRREDVDVIGVSATQYDWFPRDTMAALLPVIRAAAKPAVIAYGFSMGGYGALKYASAIGARGVLALSAQYSIDPADGTTGQRSMTYFDPRRHRGMRIAPGDYPDGAILIWDPDVPADDRHARAIARLEGIRPMPLRLSGHATAAIFSETGRLVPVAEALLGGRQADAVAGIRAARRESPTVLLAAAALLDARGHARWAAEAQRRAEAGPVDPARAIEARARAFARLGDDAQEIAALRAWQEAAPTDVEPRLRLVDRLMALGRTAEAAEVARASIAAGIADDRLPAALEEAEAAARPSPPAKARRAPRRADPALRPPPRLVGETQSIRLWLWPGSGPGTLVIFTPPGGAPAGPAGWWAQGVAGRLGWTTLVFAAHEATWYPGEEMAALLPAARAALPAEPRVTYGLGMGGYAALKYGHALGAQATVALSPAWSIDPADMPGDVRAQRRFDPRRNAGMAVRPADLSLLPVVVFDPLLRQDAAQARRLAAMHRVRAVRIHRGGQALASILGEAGALGPLLLAALEGDAAGAVATLRAARHASPTLRAAVAKALEARGHRRWAAALHQPDAAAPPQPAAPVVATARRFAIQARALRLQHKYEAEAAVVRRWIAAEPGALEPRLNLARCLQQLGRGDEAVAALREAMRAGLRHPMLDATLVRTLQDLGRTEEAVAAAQAAVAAHPRDAEMLALLGEMQFWAGRPAEAEAAAQRALETLPGHRPALLVLALVEPLPDGGAAGSHLEALLGSLAAGPALEFEWLRLIDLLGHVGRHDAALRAVTEALRTQAPTMALTLRHGRILLRTGQQEAALACFEGLVRTTPEDVQCWYGLTEALSLLRRPDEGRDATARAAALHPADGIIAARHAGFLLELADNAGAEREARRAIALVPGAEGCRLILIEALRRQERVGEAIREAQDALGAVAGSAHVALRLGWMLMERQDAAGAAEAFAQATAQPDPPREAWVGLAEALAAADRPDEAEAAARRGLLAQPEARELRGILGQLLLSRGEADAARDALAAAFEDEAGSPAVSLAMADAWLRQGRRREALELLLGAVEAAPGHIEAELRLGQLMLEEGRVNEAAALFTRVIEAAPDMAHAWVGLSDAERLRKRVKPALEAYRRAVAAGADAHTVRHLRYRLFGELEG